GFEKISKRTGFKSFIIMLIISVLVISSPFIFNKTKQADLVIGAKLGSEPTILINMYKLLIEQETDIDVKLKPGLGKTDFNISALRQGSIDSYTAFTGTASVTLYDIK